jgi:hypothetical protein
MDFEIIIDENATKLESVNCGFGPPSQRNIAKSNIFWQLEPNQSKLLLAFDIINNKKYQDSDILYEILLFKRKTSDKNLLLAKKLIDEVKIPDWEIKQQILKTQKNKIEKKIEKELPYIKEKLKIWLGKTPKQIKIFLVYAPSLYSKGAGGHGLFTKIPTITLRISRNSEVSLSLIIHELLHIVTNNTLERKKMDRINDMVEEAIFDLICFKIDTDKNKKRNLEYEIKNKIDYRGKEYSKYIYEIYEMLKPVLNGKDDLIWKYIDWKKLEEIKAKIC